MRMEHVHQKRKGAEWARGPSGVDGRPSSIITVLFSPMDTFFTDRLFGN